VSWVDGSPWEEVRGKEIIEVLVAQYYTTDSIRDLLIEADVGLAQMELDGPLGVRWYGMVRGIHAAGGLRSLLAAAQRNDPALRAKIAGWVQESNGLRGNPPGVYDVLLIGQARRAFVGRRALRRTLKEFLEERVPILVIRGEPWTGKSYSRDFVRHAVASKDGLIFRDIDFENVASGTGAVDLLSKLCNRLGIEDVTYRENQTTKTRFSMELIDALVGRYTASSHGRSILFIDGLNRKDLESDVYALIGQLATEVVRDQLPGVQVVLTGFLGSLDRDLEVDVRIEDVVKPQEHDVHEFFERLVVVPPLSADEIDRRTARVMAVPDDVAERGREARTAALELVYPEQVAPG
jgi:hypothetical protein